MWLSVAIPYNSLLLITEGIDFVRAHQELTVSTEGDMCAQVLFLDNSLLERDRTFLVNVSSDDPAVRIGRSEMVITILDDDSKN